MMPSLFRSPLSAAQSIVLFAGRGIGSVPTMMVQSSFVLVVVINLGYKCLKIYEALNQVID